MNNFEKIKKSGDPLYAKTEKHISHGNSGRFFQDEI